MHLSTLCYSCGEEGHTSSGCPRHGGGLVQGGCYYCEQWGHQAKSFTAQQAHASTDEYERADDGYPYIQYRDYCNVYNEESEECDVKSQHGLYSLMLRVMDDASEQAMATGHVSKYDMNLDSYRTRHDSMFFVRTAMLFNRVWWILWWGTRRNSLPCIKVTCNREI